MSASPLRILRALAGAGIAATLAACAAVAPSGPAPRSRAELLDEFRSGQVKLECAACRFDFRNAEWMLRDGHHEALVVSILETGDGSGRSWYLLGRAAELDAKPHLALLYYTKSLATRRNPIVALWPLYEDVNYRIRELARAPAPGSAAPPPGASETAKPREYVTGDSVALRSRPGQVGAYLMSLSRGDVVEVIDRSAEWEQVRLASGRTGWVWGRYTSPRQEDTVEKPAAATTAKAAPASRAAKPASAKKPAAKAVAKKPSAAAKPVAKPVQEAAASKPAADAASVAKTAAAPPTPAASPTPTPLAPLARALGAQKPAPARIALPVAGSFGILGSPIPEGAKLAGQTHGVGGSKDHPTQTYEISAAASDIVGFFEREMERAGWRKSFVSSEFLLYFVKDDQTLGILVERDGGTFTLMGS